MAKNIITIGREYGSGGFEIGRKLADALGWKFYDKELISEIADKNMISESFVAENDETAIIKRRNIFQEVFPIFANDVDDSEQYIFEEQGRFIVELASKGNCVIIGRRADYYLRNHPDAVHIFLYGDLEFRAERIAKEYNISMEQAKVKVATNDKRRKTSYEYTTGRSWGDMHNYDRLIDTSTFGIDAAVDEIVNLIKNDR